MIPQDNMAARQQDNAVFLPAISSFYSHYIGKQRTSQFVPASRIPATFQNGIEGLNFLNPDAAYFYYPWSLYSAGHANIDLEPDQKEEMVRNKPPGAFILGDSGGFQIGKGVWEGNWKDPNCPKAHAKRDGVLKWMDEFMDYGMVLDIPAWIARSPKGSSATGITTYQEALDGTYVNNDYWMRHRTGKCKFLNVLQGENHTQADDWYGHMKDYCDPKVYPGTHFNGWAMAGQNMCDVHLTLRRIVTLIRDGLLEKGTHDWMHFLGVSKLEWALLLTDIQNAVRKYHNPNFTISFDCASPFLANAKGQVYSRNRFEPFEKWTYQMDSGIDDKKYARDSRLYGDVARQDGIIPHFEDSHLSRHLKVSDICHYNPGDLNKNGKEGRTSWDSFGYCLQMGHNVWMHIDAVLTANELYRKGQMPAMLASRKHEMIYFKEVVYDIIANAATDRAMDLIEEHSRYWMDIVGVRGYVGKRTRNANTYFLANFDEEYNMKIPEVKLVEEIIKPTAVPQFNSLFKEE